jgi:hypothetical protein
MCRSDQCGPRPRPTGAEGGVHRAGAAPLCKETAGAQRVPDGAPAAAAGLVITLEFNLGGSEEDFRVPDGGLHRPGVAEMWHPTAALVLEVLSPGDETWQKLPFYATHNIDELLIVDPAEYAVHWLALSDGEYRPIERSALIDLSAAELAERTAWP